MPLTTGQTLKDRYRIVALLGQGGFGAVYRAWDTLFERACALKENLDVSQESQRQFLREAKMLANLDHPNLPRVTDYFVLPGQGQYLVMDYVEGQDLEAKLMQAGGPLPVPQALAWTVQICEALEYLHAQNPPVIHRDIKPANIKIRPDGRAMLVDFGIAKVYDPHLMTTVGARAVTPGFSPPEQYGRGKTDARSDVYALGATLYTLLSGAPLPDSVDIMSGGSPPPRPLSAANPAVSDNLSAAVGRAIQTRREDRFENVAWMRAAISAAPAVPSGGAGTLLARTAPVSAPSAAPPRAAPQSVASGSAPSSRQTIAGLPGELPWGWIGAVAAFALVVVVLLFAAFGGGSGGDGAATETEAALAGERLATDDGPRMTDERPAETSRAAIDTAAPQPTNTKQPGATFTSAPSPPPDFGVPMVMIPAGAFQRGSEEGDSDESPLHTVDLEAFYIDVYKITNARYAECVESGDCDLPISSESYSRDSYYGNTAYANYPVIYVTWTMAQAYCQWRGGDLPTEAEWEKAARGGLEGKDYPWGDEAPVCQKGANNGANFDDDGGCNDTDTEPVGSYAPNGYGLYDMAGNVWEWVLDWYGESYYNSSPAENPTGPDSGAYRVLRGGSWSVDPHSLRVANREWSPPASRYYGIGFRCARSP